MRECKIGENLAKNNSGNALRKKVSCIKYL